MLSSSIVELEEIIKNEDDFEWIQPLFQKFPFKNK